MRYYYSTICIAALIFFVGCLTTTSPTEPKRIDISFFVPDIGNTITIGDNTIVVDEIKFAVDRFNLVDADSVILQSSERIDTFIHFYSSDQEFENIVFSVEIGYTDVNNFESYDVFVGPVPSNANINDPDFFNPTNNYSLILNGKVNQQEFNFFSSTQFDKTFSFSAVSLTDKLETIHIANKILISELFKHPESGEFVDPREGENKILIEDLFKENLNVTASAKTFYDRDF